MLLFTDLSEVLTTGLKGLEHRLADRYLKDPVAKADFAEQFLERCRLTNDDFVDVMRGRMREDDYWQLFLASRGWPVTAEQIKTAFSKHLRGTVPATLDLYRRIVQYPDLPGQPGSCFVQGTPEIYVVSDHISERLKELRGNHPDVFELVTDAYWSCELGVVKRDPEFFPRILDDLCVDPGEVLFVDDMLMNVKAAARAGIPGVCFQNANQLEETLRTVYGFEFAPAASAP